MSYIGTNKVGKMYLGSTAIGKAYLGNDLVYDSAGGGTTPVLPSGYTQLEYIQGFSKSQVTPITAYGSTWEVDAVCDSAPSSNQIVICSDAYGGHFAGPISGGKWGLGASNVLTVNVTTRSLLKVAFNTANGMSLTIGNETISREGNANHSTYVELFGWYSTYRFSGKVYGVKCLSGGSFHGIPAKRDSDNHIGLYDTANNVFYSLTD